MKKILQFCFLLLFISSGAFSLDSPILVEPPKGTSVVIEPVILDWLDVAGIDCYIIEITTDTAGNNKQIDTCDSFTSTYTIPAEQTQPDTRYFWRVFSHIYYGSSVPSQYFSFKTAAPTAAESIENIQDGVIDLIADLSLSSSQGNILNSRLEFARSQLEQDRRLLAILGMYLFKLRVTILEISNMLSEEDADALNYSADGVIDLIADLSPIGFNEKELGAPKTYVLGQNYPNPFNPVTTIEYTILENTQVTLKVYDMTGREVDEIVNKSQNTGTYIVNWDASGFSSGVYFYMLSAGSFVETKKMILTK
ncbi:MAG: T9SS type A sorting domain-containing protein [Chlorobi bacterium]|nr:T9SS type A sorting domain-containing protein [Chlorobiota bacterium]MCI0717187.1 T9SS type A sorting domain-containing protein [Chlorobiota bacterium]